MGTMLAGLLISMTAIIAHMWMSYQMDAMCTMSVVVHMIKLRACITICGARAGLLHGPMFLGWGALRVQASTVAASRKAGMKAARSDKMQNVEVAEIIIKKNVKTKKRKQCQDGQDKKNLRMNSKGKHGTQARTTNNKSYFTKRSKRLYRDHAPNGYYPLPTPVKEGSVCSGLNTGGFACRELHRNTEHVFACELEAHLREFILANFKMKQMFTDCTSHDFLTTAKPVDLFNAGFPCQPFSNQGLKQGEQDKRCCHKQILKYVEKHLPRIVMLENVSNLVEAFRDTLDKIVKALEDMKDENGQPAYHVEWRVLNSAVYTPQSRARIYIVAIKFMGRSAI